MGRGGERSGRGSARGTEEGSRERAGGREEGREEVRGRGWRMVRAATHAKFSGSMIEPMSWN